jgi:hypothetical protein
MSFLGGALSGREDLESEIRAKLEEHLKLGKVTEHDIKYITNLRRPVIDGKLELSEARLNAIRQLCQLWQLEVSPIKITSHRRVIGPIIVFIKKLLYPILSSLLSNTLKKQSNFNAQAIILLTEMADQIEKQEKKSS